MFFMGIEAFRSKCKQFKAIELGYCFRIYHIISVFLKKKSNMLIVKESDLGYLNLKITD